MERPLRLDLSGAKAEPTSGNHDMRGSLAPHVKEELRQFPTRKYTVHIDSNDTKDTKNSNGGTSPRAQRSEADLSQFGFDLSRGLSVDEPGPLAKACLRFGTGTPSCPASRNSPSTTQYSVQDAPSEDSTTIVTRQYTHRVTTLFTSPRYEATSLPASTERIQDQWSHGTSVQDRGGMAGYYGNGHGALGMSPSSPSLTTYTSDYGTSYQELLSSYNKLLQDHKKLLEEHTSLATKHAELKEKPAPLTRIIQPMTSQGQRRSRSSPPKTKGGIPLHHRKTQIDYSHRYTLPVSLRQSIVASNSKLQTLGVLRVDDDSFDPPDGHVDCDETFRYEVRYQHVPGLTEEFCYTGCLPQAVQHQMVSTIKQLENAEVGCITGDCSAMLQFQDLMRRCTSKPLFMSALAQLPAIVAGYAETEQFAIFTVNATALKAMWSIVLREYAVDLTQSRFLVIDCNMPGFNGGREYDEEFSAALIKKSQDVLFNAPAIRVILLETTGLSVYSEDLRANTHVLVYDVVTCADYIMSGMESAPRRI